ncbi:MAG: hypothetical protein LBF84_00530 [Holosporales bacterium]|nr:hypothetical protein [Holosporales bacterium]
MYSISRSIGSFKTACDWASSESQANMQNIAGGFGRIVHILDQCYSNGFKRQCDSRLAAFIEETTESLPLLAPEINQLSFYVAGLFDAGPEDILSDLPVQELELNASNVLSACHAINESIDVVIRSYNSEEKPPLRQFGLQFETVLFVIDLWAKRLQFICDIDDACDGAQRNMLKIFLQELQRLYLKITVVEGLFIKSVKEHALEEITTLLQSGVSKSFVKQDGADQRIFFNELLSKMNKYAEKGAVLGTGGFIFDKGSLMYKIGNLTVNLLQVLDEFKIKR